MITLPQGFWLIGKPREILQQIYELRQKHAYVHEVLCKYLN